METVSLLSTRINSCRQTCYHMVNKPNVNNNIGRVCSFPCTSYSQAKNSEFANNKGADQLIRAFVIYTLDRYHILTKATRENSIFLLVSVAGLSLTL